MLHYEMSRALADQHIHDLVTAAERHALLAAATHDSTDATESSTRIKDVITQMMAPFHARRGDSARSTVTSACAGGPTMTSASGAGPIGCSA